MTNQSPAPVAGAVVEAVAWLKSGECNVGPRSEKAIAVVLEALAEVEANLDAMQTQAYIEGRRDQSDEQPMIAMAEVVERDGELLAVFTTGDPDMCLQAGDKLYAPLSYCPYCGGAGHVVVQHCRGEECFETDENCLNCNGCGVVRDARHPALAALHPQPAPAVAVDEIMERAAFVAEAKRRGWTPGDFMLGAYAGWLAARSAPAVAESQWISVEDQMPAIVDDNDVDVYTWDGKTVAEDTYGPEWEQPAGPAVGGWLRVGDNFADIHRTVTHWMPRTPPAHPTVGSGSAQEGQANG